MAMASYSCPLCHQPVSKSLYDRITGIWQERRRQLEQVAQERRRLKEEIRDEKRRLKQRIQQFRSDKEGLIRKAVEKKTKSLEREVERTKRKEKQIEDRANARIERITRIEHSKAEQAARSQLGRFKRDLRESTASKMREAREQIKQGVERKYQNLRYSFDSAIRQMKSQDKKMQDQQDRIKELERQLRRQTTPSVEGLLYEETLLRELKKKFPTDKYLHTGKGGDILQFVFSNKVLVGKIVYECKRVKTYSSRHVSQALDAKVQRKADFAILVTSAMKRGTQGFFAEKEVLIVHPAGVLALVSVLRTQIVRIADLKLGRLERDKAISQTLAYLQGPEFSNSMEGIVGETISLYGELRDEIKKHLAVWKKRYDSYAKIHTEASKVKSTTNAMLSGETQEKQIEVQPFPELVELPMVESQ